MNTQTPIKKHALLEVIEERHSPRAFADTSIPSEELALLFEAARWSASSYNEQPWRFLVGQKGDQTYEKILETLFEGNQIWAKNAPVLILVTTQKAFTKFDRENQHAWYDAGQAVAQMTLQATEMDLFLHQMAGFSTEKARESFQIPAEFDVVAAIAVGKKGDPAILPENLEKMERAPRQRKPLNEIVFNDNWGNSWQ